MNKIHQRFSVRKKIEEGEEKIFSSLAQFSAQSQGRRRPETQDDLRTCYQVDRDRIIYSPSFRRLKFKTQVFIEPIHDDTRTRLTHTLEVVQLSRTLARALRLNEDLTEAIALGHDLGHVPFAHVGEEVLDQLSDFGFHHSIQSLRVVDFLEKNGSGLNLSAEVRDGIAGHSKSQSSIFDPVSSTDDLTREALIVRYCDSVAYLNHDIEDAVRAGYLNPSDIPDRARSVLGRSSRERIENTIRDMILTSREEKTVTMSPKVGRATDILRNFMFEELYLKLSESAIDREAYRVMEELYDFFSRNPELIYRRHPFLKNNGNHNPVVDFISLQSDFSIVKLYKKYIKKPLRYLPDYG
ncbi:MAG: deoxyguanosinetriphosphate triphosphohydrolase [bacterium]